MALGTVHNMATQRHIHLGKMLGGLAIFVWQA